MFPQQIGVILTRLEQAGFAAYAVGGCVRDTLLGRVPEDWDVTTAAPTPCTFPIRWRRIWRAAI